MSEMSVADIIRIREDDTGLRVETIYSRVAGVYVVYSNSERLMVHYADEDTLAREQRLALAHLAPMRGEIGGLLESWRTAGSPQDKVRARKFDRRTADALVVALQGDQDSAIKLLVALKADILEERASIGRAEYAGFATSGAIILFLVFALLWWKQVGISPNAPSGNDEAMLWFSACIGCLGALFSIALGIRSRDIQSDFRLLDNLVDASLRVVIGAISAVVLFSLIRGNLVSVSLGGGSLKVAPDGASQATDTFKYSSIVVAFLAGFSERLVGDFLGKATLSGIVNASAKIDMSATSASSKVVTDSRKANELNPRGAATPQSHMSTSAISPSPDNSADQCLYGTQLENDVCTDDADLPEASGGVEAHR